MKKEELRNVILGQKNEGLLSLFFVVVFLVYSCLVFFNYDVVIFQKLNITYIPFYVVIIAYSILIHFSLKIESLKRENRSLLRKIELSEQETLMYKKWYAELSDKCKNSNQ